MSIDIKHTLDGHPLIVPMNICPALNNIYFPLILLQAWINIWDPRDVFNNEYLPQKRHNILQTRVGQLANAVQIIRPSSNYFSLLS